MIWIMLYTIVCMLMMICAMTHRMLGQDGRVAGSLALSTMWVISLIPISKVLGNG